jgi:hypothetical protein
MTRVVEFLAMTTRCRIPRDDAQSVIASEPSLQAHSRHREHSEAIQSFVIPGRE